MDEVKACSVLEIAKRADLKVIGRSVSPCPCCGSERRGSKDSRGPVSFSPNQRIWNCWRGECKATGDAVAFLAALALGDHQPGGKGKWPPHLTSKVKEAGMRLGVIDTRGRAVAPVSRARAYRPPAPLPKEAPPNWMPAEEAESFWSSCWPVRRCGPALSYLHAKRGFTKAHVEAVDTWDLSRVLPESGALPSWAFMGRRSWREAGLLLVTPWFSPSGEIRGFQARSIRPEDGTKAFPRGFERRGLVMACPSARASILSGRAIEEAKSKPQEEWSVERVLVVEGQLNWLLHAIRYQEPCTWDHPTAVIGITSGSWSEGVARSVPSGMSVAVDTDHDDTGDRYWKKVSDSLKARCRVRRVARRESSDGR